MRHYLVSITDPAKEKLVTDILHEIEGVEVERMADTPKRTGPALPKANGRAKLTRPGTSRPGAKKLVLTPNEAKFMKGLTKAFREMDEHIAGKRKLKTLKEVLNEL